MVPLPEPLDPEVIVIHEGIPVTVHAQPPGATMAKDAVPPPDGIDWPEGFNE
jgi:hypothetical protein